MIGGRYIIERKYKGKADTALKKLLTMLKKEGVRYQVKIDYWTYEVRHGDYIKED